MRPPTSNACRGRSPGAWALRSLVAWLPAVLVWACAIGICALGACGGGAADPTGDAALFDAEDPGADGATDAVVAGDDAADGAAATADDAGDGADAAAVVNACPQLEAAPTCPDPPTRYADVEPIIQRRCVTCHFDGATIWPLTTYEDNVDWADLIRPDLVQCTMPPPDSDAGITAGEWTALIDWLACGTLQ